MTAANIERKVTYVSLLPAQEGTSAWGRMDGDPDAYTRELSFVVQGFPADDEMAMDPQAVGRLHATEVLAGAALSDVSLFEVCDAHSQDLHELYCTLMDDETGDVREEVDLLLGTDFFNSFDWLYVHSDEVLDYSWGPQALRVVMENATNYRFLVVGVSGLVGDWSEAQKATARARSDLLIEMGFSGIEGTPYFVLNPALRLPEFPPSWLDASAESSLLRAGPQRRPGFRDSAS